MKVLFLDIDGVLNSHVADYAGEAYRIDRQRVAQLNRIVELTGARIVVSSDWRLFYGWRECARILQLFGFTGQVVDGTPEITLSTDPGWEAEDGAFELQRREEIEAWITEHPVQRHVILDDLEVYPQGHRSMVRTDGECGLTEADARRAVVILGEK